ncbi:MAG: hypothetical protein EBR82_59520 [Caulobacteraceae bacterium]|nr:hypothetical protein [Caulobacteraceae bacterium]
MSKLIQGYCIVMLAAFGWVAVGILAIPIEYRQFDDDLRVAPLKMRAITEPNDIQPAGDAGLLWTTTDPQPQ